MKLKIQSRPALVAGVTGILFALMAPTLLASDWEHQVGFSGFVFGMEGDAGAKGVSAEVDLSKEDVLEDLQGAFTALVIGDNGRWGYWASFEYVDVGDDAAKVLFPDVTNVFVEGKANFKTVIVDSGLSYHIPGVDWLEALVGVRYWGLEQDLKSSRSSDLGGESRSVSNDEQWLDGFAGVKAEIPIANRWGATIRLDAGGGGSDSSYQALGLVNFAVTERWTTVFGYRYLKVDYEDGGFLFDMTMKGFELAVLYRL